MDSSLLDDKNPISKAATPAYFEVTLCTATVPGQAVGCNLTFCAAKQVGLGLPDGRIEPFRSCERSLREAEEGCLGADLGL